MAEKKTVSVKVVAKFRDKEDLSVVHEAGEVLTILTMKIYGKKCFRRN